MSRRDEVVALEAMGHKRLLLLTGEHPKYSFERFLEAVQVVSSAQLPALPPPTYIPTHLPFTL
jgi:2-iminoacetate synthase ThiH